MITLIDYHFANYRPSWETGGPAPGKERAQSMAAIINSITENGLLYLFTTIAQCLAGAIALLAAFALYSLQSINKSMSDLSALIVQTFRRFDSGSAQATTLETLVAEGRYHEFIDKRVQLLAEWPHLGSSAPSSPLIDSQINRLRANMEAHKKIKSALWTALIASSIVMTASIAATPAARFVACWHELAWGVAAGFTACFVGCLWLFYKLIRAALRV
jgi:hypothetical protein